MSSRSTRIRPHPRALAIPFVYGAMGAVMTALMCWLYNVLAARLGGIELELSIDG